MAVKDLKQMDEAMFDLPKLKSEAQKRAQLKKIAPILRKLGLIETGADYEEIARAYNQNLLGRIKHNLH